MKKSVVSLMIALLSIGVLVAADKTPVEEAMSAAGALYYQKDFKAAKAAFDKVVKDFPSADVNILVRAQTYSAYCLQSPEFDLDYAGAQTAYEKIMKDHPNASADSLANVQYCIGACLLRTNPDKSAALAATEKALTDYPDASADLKAVIQRYCGAILFAQQKYPAAQAAYEKTLSLYPKSPAHVLVGAYSGLGDSLAKQNKLAEANRAYMTLVQNYVQPLGAKDEAGLIWKTWEKIDPKQVSSAEYRDFLDATIRVTKATEDNAKFLGKVKSELEKMK